MAVAAALAFLVAAASLPADFGTRSLKRVELSYDELTEPCKNAHAITGLLPVASVAECEQKCDAQAAAAPGTGEAACVAVDTDGAKCYLKSACDGTPGRCSHDEYRHGSLRAALAAVPADPAGAPRRPLREAAAKHGIFIGAATNVAGVTSKSEPLYKSVEQRKFADDRRERVQGGADPPKARRVRLERLRHDLRCAPPPTRACAGTTCAGTRRTRRG